MSSCAPLQRHPESSLRRHPEPSPDVILNEVKDLAPAPEEASTAVPRSPRKVLRCAQDDMEGSGLRCSVVAALPTGPSLDERRESGSYGEGSEPLRRCAIRLGVLPNAPSMVLFFLEEPLGWTSVAKAAVMGEGQSRCGAARSGWECCRTPVQWSFSFSKNLSVGRASRKRQLWRRVRAAAALRDPAGSAAARPFDGLSAAGSDRVRFR